MFENFCKLLIIIFLSLYNVRGSPVEVVDKTTFDPCKAAANLQNLHPAELIRNAKSAEIQNNLNLTANPCENFYNFVCGSYEGHKSTGHAKSVRLDLKNKMEEETFAMLSSDEPADKEIDKKVKHFFQSCLNVESSAVNYRDKLQQIVAEFGQMPALQGSLWQQDEFDWLKTVAEIAFKYDIKIIVGYKVKVDFYANEVAPLRIIAAPLGLGHRTMYSEAKYNKSREFYEKGISANLKKYLNLEEQLAELTAKEIFDFETLLAQATEKSSENLTTIDEMQLEYAALVDIKRLVNISLGYVPTGEVYDALKYDYAKLSTLLQETPKSNLANYIFYHLLKEFMVDHETAKETCLARTNKYFSKIIKVMLYRKYVTKETRQSVQHMWQTIKNIFKNQLESGSWMTDHVRQYAVEKLEATDLEIHLLKNINLTEEFHRLTVYKEDFVDNMRSILQLRALQHRELSTQVSYDNDFHRTYYPAYYPTENKIIIPASLLKPNFLWSDFYPASVKYSTLGVFIAHQLIHGFDEDGRNYDKQGNEFDWWDEDSSLGFDQHSQCFAEQYRQYFADDQLMDEFHSQLENIADNGAVRLAYQAYLKWLEMCPHTNDLENMPALDYNNKQLFFIAYGQTRCSTSVDFLDDYATAENTVSDEFRITVPLSNFEEFSHEFMCPQGSTMNPIEKCAIY